MGIMSYMAICEKYSERGYEKRLTPERQSFFAPYAVYSLWGRTPSNTPASGYALRNASCMRQVVGVGDLDFCNVLLFRWL